ncbi:hypothetical protein D3C71_1379940 [compost metagenome]
MHVESIIGLVDYAHIDGGALCDDARRLVTVIIAIVFKFQPQWLPGRLVLYPAKESGRPMEQAAKFKFATTAREPVVALAPGLTSFTEGVLDVATLPHISPCHAQGEIQVLVTLAGNYVLAVKESGPHDITKPDRDMRAPGGFIPESGFDIHPLVFIGLIATEALIIAIQAGANVGVSQGGFQPVEWLHGDRPASIFLVIHVVERELTFWGHARRWHLKQTYATKVTLGGKGRGETIRIGASDRRDKNRESGDSG